MIRFVVAAVGALIVLCGCAGISLSPSVTTLPDIVLNVPDDAKYRSYLGLDGLAGEPFSIGDIDAEIVLIELFNMYCPYCQAAAPRVNELYRLMEEQRAHGVSVKIIGVGAGNTPFEVEFFRKSFQIDFPLFPDKNLAVYKSLNGAGTPVFIGCVLKDDAPTTIVLRESGEFDNAEEFLELLLRQAKTQ